MRSLTGLFALLLSASACASNVLGSDGFDLDAAPELTLSETIRIGDSDDPSIGFSQVRAVEVDRDGNVYVLDGREREIRVFDPRGQLVRRIGRRGSGPGEFEQVPRFGLWGDTVWAVEASRYRITLFERVSGNVIASALFSPVRVRLPPPRGGFAVISPMELRSDGTFASDMWGMTFSRDDPPTDLKEGDTVRIPRVRFAASGNVLDTIGWDARPPIATGEAREVTSRGRRYYLPDPPSVGDRSAVLPDGRAFIDAPSASDRGSARFHLTRISLTGDTVRRTAYRYTPTRFNDALLDSLAWRSARLPGGGIAIIDGVPQPPQLGADSADAFREIRAAMAFPPFQPPVLSFFRGKDDEILLRRENAGDNRQRWLVLRPDDSVRGMVTIPANARIAWARGDAVWLIELDADDIPWVVRYSVR